MFNQKALAATVAVTLVLILPTPSRAASRTWAPLSRPAEGFFTKIERWSSLLLNGPARPSFSPVWEKQGCGMDPNGKPLCDPGPGPTQTPPPDPGAR